MMDRPQTSQAPSSGRSFPLLRPTTSAAREAPLLVSTTLPSPFEDESSFPERAIPPVPDTFPNTARWRATSHNGASTGRQKSFSGIHIVVEEPSGASRWPGQKKSARLSGLFRHRSRETLSGEPSRPVESPRLSKSHDKSSGGSWLSRAASVTFRGGRRRSTFGESATLTPRPLLEVPTRVSSQSPAQNGFDQMPTRPGEAARAAAAASNERLEAIRPPPPPPLPSKETTARLRRMKSSDNESGIGIDLQEPTALSAESSAIPRVDPASLPEELFHHILSYLDADSLTEAELVSRRWSATAGANVIWRGVFGADYISNIPPVHTNPNPSTPIAPQVGGLGVGRLRQPSQPFKQMWKTRAALDARWHDGHAAARYLHGHKDSVYCVQFDEEKIVTGSRDRTIRVWDLQTLQCLKVLGKLKVDPRSAAAANNRHAPMPTGLAPSSAPDARTGSLFGSTLHRLPSALRMARQKPFMSIDASPADRGPTPEAKQMNHAGSVLCLQFDKTTMVSGSSDTTLIVWDISTPEWQPVARLRRHAAPVLDVCFDNHRIVSCSKDTTVCVWERRRRSSSGSSDGVYSKSGTHCDGDRDEPAFRLLARFTSHEGPVNAVQLRGDHLVSASGDGIAKLWNLASGTCVKEFPSRKRGLACVEFSPDCRTILTGGNDHVVYQFDANSGELVRELTGHSELVRSLHLDFVNRRVVSGSYDYSVKAFDLASGRLLCDFVGWTSSWILCAKADYRRIIATSQDGRVVVMDFGYGLEGIELLEGCSIRR